MDLYLSKTMKIEDFDGLHIIQDHIGTNYKTPWNDYGYTIFFGLFYVDKEKKQKIGNIRILINEEFDSAFYFSQNCDDTSDKNISKITKSMDPTKMVSMPTDIEFYKVINKCFMSEKKVNEVLELLCDISFFRENYYKYKSWEGFSGALSRSNSNTDSLLKTGYFIAIDKYDINRKFSIKIDNICDTIEPISLNFDNKEDFLRKDINLIIGKNGVGKTSILKHISDSILGVVASDDMPYINKLLVVSYSPFESFITGVELSNIRDEKYKNDNEVKKSRFSNARKLLSINDYTYIGFKNKDGVFDLDWPKEYAASAIIDIILSDNNSIWWRTEKEYSKTELLFNTLSLAIDFDSFKFKTHSENVVIINRDTTRKIKKNNDIDYSKGVEIVKDGKAIPLSSGQLIYSYMIPTIISEIKDESLLIIDEPELYLHPTLEMGLIKMLKTILKDSSSYAIIATHSSVLAREIPKNSVLILRQKEGVTINDNPRIETYGESLDAIVGEVFDDYFQVKPYQKELDLLAGTESVDEVLRKYSSNLGDEALIYLTSKLKDDTENSEYIKLEPME